MLPIAIPANIRIEKKVRGTYEKIIVNNKNDILIDNAIRIVLEGPIPDVTRNLLRQNRAEYNTVRIWSEMEIEPIRAETFYNQNLNPERVYSEEYSALFNEYMSGTTVKPEYVQGRYINFGISVKELRNIYTVDLLDNASTGTYTTHQELFTRDQQFKPTKLLNDDWRTRAEEGNNNLLMETRRGEPPVGRNSFFFHPTAAAELTRFYEQWIHSLGFAFSFLDADVVALATKVYGPAGYYPIWTRPGQLGRTVKDGNAVILDAGKVGRISPETSIVFGLPYNEGNVERLVTEDTSTGPHMFKPLPNGWMPRWPQAPGQPRVQIRTKIQNEIRAGVTRQGGSRHKRKTKSKRKSKSKTKTKTRR